MAGIAVAVLGLTGLPARAGGRWLRCAAAVVTLAGVASAGVAVALVSTAWLSAHGMVIPALHDAASDEPITYIPVCGRAVGVPVCLNPAYRRWLPEVTAALAPVLAEVTGLPGAPVRAAQVAAAYRSGESRPFQAIMLGGSPPVLHVSLGLLDMPGPCGFCGRPVAAKPFVDQTTAGLHLLARLYLVSRRVPMALALLAGLGALLWAALYWRWNIAGGAAARQFIPLTIQTGAASVIAVTTYGPFGEPERAAGRWLPWLRLGAGVGLSTAAFGVLAAGAAGGVMPGGTLALLRNLRGMVGVGLLSATVLGGAFGWSGPMAYLLIAEGALAHRSAAPWVWPTRPPNDLGGAICACLVIAAGLVLITVRGPREPGRDLAQQAEPPRRGLTRAPQPARNRLRSARAPARTASCRP